MPRPGAKKLGLSFVALRLCSAQLELEDRAVLVQDTVELRRPDTVASTRQAVAALDPFTAVHYTNFNKLPGLGDKIWGGDTQKGNGAVFVSDGSQTQFYGALGGANKDQGTSHGVYGGLNSDHPGQPLFTGGWQSTPGAVKVQHTQPSPLGGMDAITTEHKFGSVPGKGQPFPPSASVAAARAHWPPIEASITDILKQPFVADTMTVAVRKQDVPRKAAWGKDDVLGSGGKLISVGPFKDGIGGVGGYSGEDQSYHFVYGTGPWIHGGDQSRPLKGGGTIGTVVGKPGQVDINHVQPTLGGGANVTFVKSRTVHLSQKELEKLIERGDYSFTTPVPGSAPEPVPPTPASAGNSSSSSSSSNSSNSSSGTTHGATTNAPAAAPLATTTEKAATTSQAAINGTSVVSTTMAVTPEATGTTTIDASSVPDVWGKITDKLGDISDGVSSKVDTVVPPSTAESSWGTDAAIDVAATVNSALTPVKDQADSLLNETVKVKEGLLQASGTAMRAKRAGSLTAEPAVERLETALSQGVRTVLARWASLREVITNATNNLTSGLRMGGQRKLANFLETSLKVVSGAANAFEKRVADAMETVPGIGQLPPPQAGVRLAQIDKLLYSASRVLGAFGPGFLAPVQDLVDRFSDALSSSGLAEPTTVQRAFSSIEHQTTAITWRVRNAGRELVMGAHQALADTAMKLDQPALTWPPEGEETGEMNIGQAAASVGEKIQSWMPWSGAARGSGELALSLVVSCSLLVLSSTAM